MSDYPLESFVFYRSFRDAIEEMDPGDQLSTLLAICDYALYGVEPKLSSPMARAVFTVSKPSIDANKKRRKNGEAGGRPKKETDGYSEKNQRFSKNESTEAENVSETASETVTESPSSFDRFWNAYPKKIGKTAAKKAFVKARNVPVESLLAAIERQKCGDQWSRDGGKYIPNPATWLNQGRWEDEVSAGSANQTVQFGWGNGS